MTWVALQADQCHALHDEQQCQHAQVAQPRNAADVNKTRQHAGRGHDGDGACGQRGAGALVLQQVEQVDLPADMRRHAQGDVPPAAIPISWREVQGFAG